MQSQPGKTDEGCAIARRDSVCSAPWPQSLCPDCSCGRSLERTAFTLTLSLFSGRGSWKFLWLLAGTLHPVFFVAPFVPSSEILLPLAQPQTLGPGRASPLMAACLSNGQQEPSGLLPGVWWPRGAHVGPARSSPLPGAHGAGLRCAFAPRIFLALTSDLPLISHRDGVRVTVRLPCLTSKQLGVFRL